MKKRSAIRVISVLLLIGMLFSFASVASATDQVQPRYQKIVILTSELLDINWLGKATFCGTVSLLDETCLIDLFVDLQRSEDGVDGWTTIKTWSATGYEDVVIEKSYYVASGYYYRIGTTAIIYDAQGNFVESDGIASAVLYH